MIRASTFRPPVRLLPTRPIPVSYDVDERIRAESVRVAEGSGVHVTAHGYDVRRLAGAAALMAGDLLSLASAILASVGLRTLVLDPMAAPGWMALFLALWVIAALFWGLYPGWGIGPVDELRALSRTTLFAGASTVVALSMARSFDEHSRFVLVASLGMALGAVPLVRYAVRRLLLRFGWWGVPVAVYGSGASAQRLVHLLQDQPHVGLHPVGVFDDDPSFWGHAVESVPVLGDTRLVHPDAAVAVLVASDGAARKALAEGPLRYYRRVLLIPDLAEQSSLVTNVRDVGGLLGLELRVNLASPVAQFTKRSVDVLLTAVTAPAWAALVALGATAVWLGDRSNPFFAQRRTGRGGREIRVWKLRTMVPDAEARLELALQSDADLRAEWEATAKLRRDPRITKVGRVIRRLSVDELPQLWNVLRGEMSLVGPRPLPSYHEQRLPESGRELRRHVRPGVTGLWQVSGRSDTGDDAMGWLDAYYVRNWSLWLDAAILFRTVRAVAVGNGAY